MWKQILKFIFLLFILFLLVRVSRFMCTWNPIALCLSLIFISACIRAQIFALISKWLSTAIILVFIGGIIIVFLYISSLSLNNKISLIYLSKLDYVFIRIRLLLLIWTSIKEATDFNFQSKIFEVYHPVPRLTILFLIVFLLFVLLLVVKIRESFKGSLVQKF